MAASNKTPDVELGRVRDGYPALARWIARDPDNEGFVFRKFNRLGARNILHLQSQLTALEHGIDQLDEQARTNGDEEARRASRRFETLMMHQDDTDRPEKMRIDKLSELETVLKRYYKALLLQAQISEFQGPSSRVLNTFRDYTEGRAFKIDGLDSASIITGRAKDFLKDKVDLIALRKSADEDVLSKFLQDHWAFQKRTSNDPLDRTTIYKNGHVVRTVATISMTIAAVLLISAILSLHVVVSDKAKLGLVAMYTLLFALSGSLLTNARRAEVFAATAAYAAVLVVFVSGDLGGSNQQQCLVQLENGYFQTVSCPT